MCEICACLLKQKNNSDLDFVELESGLNCLLTEEVIDLARRLGVKQAGSYSKKVELIARLLSKPRLKLGVLQDRTLGSCGRVESSSVSCATPEIALVLRSLPTFSDEAEDWTKDVGDKLGSFRFVYPHAYLIESANRRKSFFLKASKVSSISPTASSRMWMKAFASCDIVYFRSLDFCSLTVNTLLTIFVSMCESTGDVYSGQCNCVADCGGACNNIAAYQSQAKFSETFRQDCLWLLQVRMTEEYSRQPAFMLRTCVLKHTGRLL